MGRRRLERARRVEPDLTSAPIDHDYVSSFAIVVQDANARPAEQWIRATLEGAPRALRGCVRLGWRAVLRLRLGPAASPGHVLGWAVRVVTTQSVVLEAHSTMLTATKVLRVDEGRVTLTTFVRYERRRARIIWSVVALVHHRLEPLLLTSAAVRVTARPTAAEAG